MDISKESNYKPLVSIGLPLYNTEKTIFECLENIEKQTYENIEVIISDNASEDKTIEIVENFIKKKNKYKLFKSQTNRGIIWNFNNVFIKSNGEYFCWFSHDDIRSEKFIEKCLIELIKNHKAVLCQGETSIIFDNKTISRNSLQSFKYKKNIYERYNETLNNFPATGIYGLYRSEAIKKTKLLRNSIAGDIIFINNLSIYGSFLNINQHTLNYRIRQKWNSLQEDYFAFYGRKKPKLYLPFFVFHFYNFLNIYESNINIHRKLVLFLILFKKIIKDFIFKIFKKIIFKSFNYSKEKNKYFYFKFIHNSNIEIINSDKYYTRIIKPILGINDR